MEIIINYLLAAIKALCDILGVEFKSPFGEGTKDNLETMYDNITGYEPEV